jgi:hypothetical protein
MRLRNVLVVIHLILCTVGMWIGSFAARSTREHRSFAVVSGFFAPAARLNLRYGSIAQAREAVRRCETSMRPEGDVAVFQRRASLMTLYAALAERELREGQTVESNTAVDHAVRFCVELGYQNCTPGYIRSRLMGCARRTPTSPSSSGTQDAGK